MRGKKFISLTLSTMLCLQLLPTASFAAAPATDTGNAGLIAEGDYALPAMASASLMTRTGRQSLCTAQRDLGSSR